MRLRPLAPHRGRHLSAGAPIDLERDRAAADALPGAFLFQGLPSTELALIRERLDLSAFAAGSTIVREGDPGDACYVVVSGEAAAVTRDLTGQDVTLQRFGPRSSFGAVALAVTGPRTATVRAITDVSALVLTRAAYGRIAGLCPVFGARLREYVDFLDLDRFLRRASPFARLPQDTLRAMIPRLSVRRVAPGETVVREGEPGERFYLVRGGSLEVTRRGRKQQELRAGDCFGEVALVAGGMRVATIRAVTDAELLALERSDFDEVIAADPSARARLVELARIHGGQGLAVPDPISTLMPFLAAKRRDRYWRMLILGIGLFAAVSLVAARSGDQIAIYGALVLGSFVVPVVYVTYLAEADILAAHPRALAFTFVLGAALGLPVAIALEGLIGASPGALDSAFGVALVEETAKVLGVAWLLGRSSSRFQMDGVVYGAAAGMGFAAFETVLFGLDRLETPGVLLATLWLRSLLAPFGHGTWTAIVGATIWGRKRGGVRVDTAVVGAFALAVGLHTLWDWQPLPGAPGLVSLLAIGAVGIWVLRATVARATREEIGSVVALNPELLTASGAAPRVVCESCGQVAPPGAHYCVRCGAALRVVT